MEQLQKPPRLRAGDRVAAVSLSWGGAGEPELLWRYELGKRRMKELFGLEVVEMPNTLKGEQYLALHPEKRAQDLMQAFSDPSIRGIFSCIGGCESVRMLPYLNFEVIRRNPKVFLGYSDTTVTHFICRKAGLSSFYGPSILAEMAENVEMFPYTVNAMRRMLFQPEPFGPVEPAPEWTGERLEWTKENAAVRKALLPNTGYEVLQGSGVVQGRLLGGCMTVLEMLKGTALWPRPEEFDGCILFFETSEDMPPPHFFEYWLRNYGSQGILQRVKALLFGRPYQEKYAREYRGAVEKVLGELQLSSLPVVCNMTFGHNEPMCLLPYGAMAQVDCGAKTFSILEGGVL